MHTGEAAAAPAEAPPARSAAETLRRPFPGGIRFELVTAEPDSGRTRADLVEPFVTLGDRGRFSRTLLAHVVGPDGRPIRELALKVQRDDYPVTDLPGWSNADIDTHWQEQYRLWQVAAANEAAPAPVSVLPEPEEGGAPCLPPTLYCKERDAFFTAPCPDCGAALLTCRDDGLLEKHGLPRYDGSLERFLYCTACVDAGRAPRFYALILADPALRTRAPVAEQTDLYVAFGRLAREGGPLPCAGCANVPSCYPEGGSAAADVTRLLTPVSFYDYRCLPLERFALHYDEFAALLGGRAGTGPWPESQPQAAAQRRYLFQDDPRGKLPLEILRLKLALFTQLVSAVGNLHSATGLPHLALAPENVMVDVSTAGAGLPAFYNFRTRLVGIGGCRRRRFDGLDSAALAVPALEPAPVRDATFAAPLLAVDRPVVGGRVAFTGLTPAGEGRIVLEADLASAEFDVQALRPKDAVHVIVRQGRPVPLAVEFLANPTQAGAGSVPLRSTPVVVEEGSAHRLQSLVGQEPVRASLVIHPCLHAPCDLQSLGVFLFTTLLANQTQGPPAVATAARQLSADIAQFAQAHVAAGAEEINEYTIGKLREAEAAGWLAEGQMLDAPDERGGWEGTLGSFWHAAMLLGLRALTQTPGFGFCRGHDDFDPAHPEGPVDHLRAELDILGHSIDAELLAMHGKRREITEAVARVRARLSGAGEGAHGGVRR